MASIVYRCLADLVLTIHLGFVAFVVLGGLLVLRRPSVAWLHVPSAVWGVVIEYSGALCPLTPLENLFRRRAGEGGYAGGFLEHYATALLYPAALTPGLQVVLGTAVLVINSIVYAALLRRRRSRR